MEIIQKRFDELATRASEIIGGFAQETKRVAQKVKFSSSPVYKTVTKYTGDFDGATQWVTSAKSLLHRVFGPESPTFQDFDNASNAKFNNYQTRFKKLNSIFQSAKNDFEGGYLFDVHNLVHAEVFANELDQARHFLSGNYEVAAAVTAGIVLETTIKRLCRNQIPQISLVNDKGKHITTDTLISNLQKEGAFNPVVAKQLRAWMGIRNDAAHGKRKDGDFDNREVKRMIEGVEDFVAKHVN